MFIVNGESLRIKCQRIINHLLVQLNSTKDYEQFCYLFNMITITVDLSDKLRRGQLFKYCNDSNMYELLSIKCLNLKFQVPENVANLVIKRWSLLRLNNSDIN